MNFHINKDDLLNLYPLTLGLSLDGQLIYASERMLTHVGEAWQGKHLTDFFKLKDCATNFSIAEKNLDFWIGKIIHIELLNEKLACRAKIINTEIENQSCFLLLCNPWLSWMAKNYASNNVSIADYPFLDTQPVMETQLTALNIMQRDLESLTHKLTKSRNEAMQTIEDNSNFVLMVSHELRTPLNGLLNAIELLESTSNKVEKIKFLQIANRSGKFLLSLVNKLLEYGKDINTPINETCFSTETYFENIVSLFSSSSLQLNIVLNFIFDKTLPQYIKCDDVLISRIIINMLSNSITHSGSKTIALSVRPVSIPDASGKFLLRIEVEDWGVGISADDQKNIFNMFWRKPTHTANSRGSGLGLHICKTLANTLRGKVGVVSTVGKGSTFWIEIEAQKVLQEIELKPAVNSIYHLDTKFNGHVLLVDDNDINLEIGSIILKQLGFRVDQTDSGEAAVNLAAANKYALIYMDIMMPGIGGLEASTIIKANPLNSKTPIIALTAHLPDVGHNQYALSGIIDVIPKPIERDTLIAKTKLALALVA